MRITLLLLAAAFALPVLPAASRAGEPYVRAGWAVGVAYGPARGQVDGPDSLVTGWLDGPAQSIRVGFMLNPNWKVGYEHQAWVHEQGLYDLKVRAGVQLEALGVTAYPGRAGTPWYGLYVTAGAGWAHNRLTLLEPLAPGESAIGDTYEVVFKQDEYGWGWYGGLGYELPISRHFAASVLASYNYTDIGGSIYDSARFIPLVASLNWNF